MRASVRRVVGLLSGAALAVTAASSAAGPAAGSTANRAAVQPGGASVPPHAPATADLQLLGRAEKGALAAIQNGGAVLTGAPAGNLAARGAAVDEPYSYSDHVHDLTRNVLRWAEPRPKGLHWVVSQVDVTGGRTTHYDSPEAVLAFTGAGWLGVNEENALVEHVPGAHDRTLLTGVGDYVDAAADARSAAVLYAPPSGLGMRLVLIDLATGHVEKLTAWTHDVAHPALNQEWPGLVTLTPRDVVWTGWTGLPEVNELTPKIHRRARSGGAVTTIEAPYALGELVATDDRLAAFTFTRHPSPESGFHYAMRMQTWQNGDWQPVPLPGQDDTTGTPYDEDYGGVSADASGILFALSGDLATQAGVYTLTSAGEASRIGTLAPGTETISDVSLNAGRLTFGRRAVGAPADRPVPIMQSQVSPGPALGPAERAGGEIRHVRAGTRPALSVSGERITSIDSADVRRQPIVDGPGWTEPLPAVAAQDRAIRSSGRYVLADDKLYAVTGTEETVDGEDHRPVLDLTRQHCLGTDLFGAVAVCSRSNGSVLVWDTGRTRSSTNPQVIRDRADGAVAVWGTAVAWHRDDGSIAYQPGRAAAITRAVVRGTVRDLRLTEGALSWEDDAGRLTLIDPATMITYDSGLAFPGMADDHLIAGLDRAGQLTVKTLPFGLDTPNPPRLISQGVPRTATGTWRAQFEVSKEVTGVTLTIRRGQTIMARLTGTSTAGDLRHLAWKGAKGTYTWRLTATAEDGEGALTPVSGTVTVRR